MVNMTMEMIRRMRVWLAMATTIKLTTKVSSSDQCTAVFYALYSVYMRANPSLCCPIHVLKAIQIHIATQISKATKVFRLKRKKIAQMTV